MKPFSFAFLLFLPSLFLFSQTEQGKSATPMMGYDTIEVIREHGLPFTEAWDSGDFDFNSWNTQEGVSNWVIDSINGNPAPSARFKWYPNPGENYSITLKSDSLDASFLSEGNIWLDFHLKLDDIDSNGTEKMTIQIYDGTDWHSVYERANEGSFDWDSIHLNITSYSKGKVFQLSFEANGDDSQNIQNWHIDNIEVYRECNSSNCIEIVYDTIFEEIYPLLWIVTCDSSSKEFIAPQRSFVGWNLYRSVNGSAFELYEVIPYNEGLIQWPYLLVPSEDFVCYQLTSTWVGNTDVCESAPFKSKANPEEDFVCLMTVGIDDDINHESNSIKIFPNPASNQLTIQSEEEMQKIELLNFVGQIVLGKKASRKQITINTSKLESGVYIIRVKTIEGIVNNRIIIEHFH